MLNPKNDMARHKGNPARHSDEDKTSLRACTAHAIHVTLFALEKFDMDEMESITEDVDPVHQTAGEPPLAEARAGSRSPSSTPSSLSSSSGSRRSKACVAASSLLASLSVLMWVVETPLRIGADDCWLGLRETRCLSCHQE